MATLFIHAGHPKTGSSYIQHVLRSNKQVLAENGIIYATGHDVNIKPGKTISTGNAPYIFDSRDNFSASLKMNRIPCNNSLLYTSEAIYRKFIEEHAEEYLEEIAFQNGFDRIKILVFIRNPISLFGSVWQQKIKTRGGTDLEFADSEYNMIYGTRWIFLLERWLDLLKKCPAVDFTILNYSTCAGNILEKLTDWLELPPVLDPTPLLRVNRSMTYSELHLMSAFNRVLGETKLLSYPLCQKITNIEPAKVLPPLDIQHKIWEFVEPVISRINPFIPAESRYHCDILAPGPIPEVIHFTPEQITIIAESLGNEILLRQNESTTRQKEIELLKLEIIKLRSSLGEINQNESSPLLKQGLQNSFTLNMTRLYNSIRKPFKGNS